MRRIRKGIISIITMILVMSSFGFCLTYAEPVNQDQITKEATVECNEEIAISADHVKTTDGFVIEPDQAFTIAMLFVAGNTERMQWDGTTSIREVVPLIDEDGDVGYYYVGLNTMGHPSGYVVVSINPESPLIIEYSDADDLPVMTTLGEIKTDKRMQERSENEVFYYAPLFCSTTPIEKGSQGISKFSEEEKSCFRDNTKRIIKIIEDNHISLRDNPGYGFIENLTAYLQSTYPNYVFEYFTGHTVSGTFNPYTINYNTYPNGCVLYGTAAILRYHLGSSYQLNSIVQTCATFAQNYNYAHMVNGHWDYYISIGYTDVFVGGCMLQYSLGVDAYSVLTLSTAKTEINNNRPCLLNIWYYDSNNIDHAVTAVGWESYYTPYEEDPFTITFYKIADGCTNNSFRYANASSISGVFVTWVHPN